MTGITTQDQPLDKRCRETHPERLTVGNVIFERNDITARRYGVSERTVNRGDAEGAPYRLFGNVKYRPQPHYDDFVVSTIQARKPQPPKRKAK